MEINLKLRDIHPTHFGRLCPLETPEGLSTGLISVLSIYARINNFGFIETPFFIVKNGFVLFNYPAIYLTSDEEENFYIAPADIKINKNGKILESFITISYQQKFLIIQKNKIQLISVSTQQIFSFGSSLIPFIEHNDATRALMGANMQRQANPLLYPHKAIIGTGCEMQLASYGTLKSYSDGFILDLTSTFIVIKTKNNKILLYYLKNYIRSNNNTYFNHRIII
jgi:DNA-directed RNA polymerase subunit beta